MTDFSADDARASSGPPPFAPVSPRREEAPFGSGAAGSAAGPGTREEPNGFGGAGPVGAGPGAPRGASGGSFPGGPAPAAGTTNGAPRHAGPMPEVKGRIDVADEVVEKVAGLAAGEVPGVADLGGDIQRALENVRERIGIGQKRGDQGIKAKISGRDVSIDVIIMIEYGHVVMDVARHVKANVARQTSRMLGLNVVEVNVRVDDIKLPRPERDERDERDGDPSDGDGTVNLEG